MKKIFIVIFVVGLFNASLVAQFRNNLGLPDILVGVKKTIYQGNHNCWPPSLEKDIKFFVDRRYKFRAHLFDNCFYYQNELDKGDGWSKLGKIAHRVHEISDKTEDCFKMHVGWRMTDDRHLRLSLFYHQNYNWVSHQVSVLPFNTDGNFTADMYFGINVLGLIINDNYNQQNTPSTCLGIRQSNNWCDPLEETLIRKTFYFGGKSTAPHKMEMRFHDQEVDYSGYQTKFNSNDIMTWNLSEFIEGDVFNYFAGNEINGSIITGNRKYIVNYKDTHPNKEYQKCIIHPDARIEFHAGQAVHLYPGFYAMHGSYFKADNNLPPALTIKETPATFAENIEYKTENALSVEFALYYDDTRDSIVYSKQAFITDSLAKITIDTVLPNQSYYAVADFYSGKGSHKRVEGYVTNDNFGFKSKVINLSNTVFSNDITIFPNPSNAIFNIEASNKVSIISIKVRNLSGQEIFSKQTAENAHSYSLDLTGRKKGIYFLTVKTTTGTKTVKLVKY